MKNVSLSASYRFEFSCIAKDLHGFNLVELLATISVIGILTGLLFPALASVKSKGRETQSRSEMTNFVNACRHFESDYGVLPNPYSSVSAGTPVEFAAVDSGTYKKAITNTDMNYMSLLSTLTGFKYLTGAAFSSTINPRALKYLTPSQCYVMKDSTYKGPCGFVDPWGNTYGISLDIDGDGQSSVKYPTGVKDGKGNGLSTETVITRVVIYSLGADAQWNGSKLKDSPTRMLKSYDK